MATQATNRTVQVEFVTPAQFEYGPSESMQADSVLLTVDKFKTIGGEAPRKGYLWSCNLQIYDTVSSAETGHDLDGYTTIGFEFWDPHIRTADSTSFSFTKDGDQSTNPGLGVLSMDTEPSAGMYRFSLIGKDAQSNQEDICSGWLEVRSQYE